MCMVSAQMPDGSWTMSGRSVVLVTESSATHGRPGEDQAHHVQAINRSHFDIVKFRRRDLEYDKVLSFLIEFAASALEVVRMRFQEMDGMDTIS